MSDTPNVVPASPPPRRVVAITEAGQHLPAPLEQLISGLRAAGAEVVLMAVPTSAPRPEPVPTIDELKRGLGHFARGVVKTLRGDFDPVGEDWLASQLRAVEGRVDAWLAVEPALARHVFPVAHAIRPDALRVAVDGDYHVEAAWREVPIDAVVVVHAGVATELTSVREGRARLVVGGVLAADEVASRHVDDKPMVVVSTALTDPGDIDPLLFQLSLAKPERFSLLFLPSGRPGVDELIRTRAANYGLLGKRPKLGAPTDGWIRGAAALCGHPSPLESAVAVRGAVPQLVFATERQLNAGDRFLIGHGAALHADLPITIAVHLEALLPGGARRDEVVKAAAELAPGGVADAARGVLEAIALGRPVAPAAEAPPAAAAGDSDLEDIGAPAKTAGLGGGPAEAMPASLRRAYLKEIILRQQTLEKQLGRAQTGLDTWQKRVRLARSAGQHDLADKAVPRVEGLLKLTDRLGAELREVRALREHFAGTAPLSDADRAAVSQFMSPDVASTLERGETPESAFTQLELADALDTLKRKLLKPDA